MTMKKENIDKPKENVEMDSCIICKKPTIYPKDTNVDYRLYYIEGAGQLCPECYEIIYNQKPRA